jgi:hypothetical protein
MVLRQFVYVQSVTRHPHNAASIVTTVEQIDQHWMQYADCALTPYYMFGSRDVRPTDTVPRYKEWVFTDITSLHHPYPRGILS